MRRIRLETLTLWFLACGALTSSATLAAPIGEQRDAFRDVYPAAERGDWKPAASRADQLHDYVLWPDLRAAFLRTRLAKGDDDQVREFLEQHGTLKPARELRYRYALRLAKERRHREFLALYARYYANSNAASLDCLAAHANIRLGRVDQAVPLARELWQVGKSQVKQCDPVFAYLRGAGLLTPELHLRRYALAIEQQEFMLARYLARSIDTATLGAANRWLRAQGDPNRFLRIADVSSDDSVYHEQLAYAARRLAYTDPEKALTHWRRLGKDIDFEDALDNDVWRHAALWAARLNLAGARTLLDGLADAAIDNEVRRWQIRSAIRDHDWGRVIDVVAALEAHERRREEWQYWRAIALQRASAEAEAMLILSGLAQERSYYGFLAADNLGIDYAFTESAVSADENTIVRLAALPNLVRAHELFQVGLDGRARSEWDASVKLLSEDEKIQAALLAHRWKWHSRAISAAAQAGEYDDLGLRYPLPHREAFKRFSTEAGVRESWAYGVARSESLFMRDIRSSAGAVGVMQLMPSTGRMTAREIKHPYKGRDTLIDPASNIRLGTVYLGKMNERFDSNPALATAAYNAGPLRVTQWLAGAGPMDTRIWVETIPYNETRNYVRRVLASDVIFHWRLTGKTSRLSNKLPEIMPAATARVARQ